MIVDVIILANSKSQQLIDMTQIAIDSLHQSETEHKFDVLVIESGPNHLYRNAVCIKPDCEFNYNKFMNIGLDICNSTWVCMANNDLVFYPGWFSVILAASEALPDVQSFSSFTKQHYDAKMTEPYYVQYGIGTFVTGWCLTVKREIFDKFKLDPQVAFWCSDNIYQDDLIKHGIKHALVRDSRVDHLGGVTLFTMPPATIHHLTATQAEIYANRKS